MKEIFIPKYVANDGNEFWSKEGCEKYELDMCRSYFEFYDIDGKKTLLFHEALYVLLYGPYALQKLRNYSESDCCESGETIECERSPKEIGILKFVMGANEYGESELLGHYEPLAFDDDLYRLNNLIGRLFEYEKRVFEEV